MGAEAQSGQAPAAIVAAVQVTGKHSDANTTASISGSATKANRLSEAFLRMSPHPGSVLRLMQLSCRLRRLHADGT